MIGVSPLIGYAISRRPGLRALLLPLGFGALALACLVMWLASRWEEDERSWLFRWTAASLVLHLMAGIMLSTVGAAVVFASGSDAGTYHSGAIDLIQHWTRGFPLDPLPQGKEGYFYVVAYLYRAFGFQPIAALVVNAVWGAALIPLMTDVTRRLFGRDQMRYVPLLVTCLPAFLVFTSPMLREAGVLFLIAVAANAAVRASERVSLGALLVMTGALAVLFTFRGNVALIVTGGLVVGIAISKREVIQALGMGASSAVIVLVLVAGAGLGYSGYQLAVGSDLRDVNEIRSELSTSAQSGFGTNVDVSTTNRALAYLPVGLVQFMLGPFPWQFRSQRQLMVLPDVLIWWALLPSLLRGLMVGKRRLGRRSFVVLLPAALVAGALALLLGNFGTVVRERLQVEVLLVPFLAAGLAERAHLRSRRPHLLLPGQPLVRARPLQQTEA
jgi:hypothetical protein